MSGNLLRAREAALEVIAALSPEAADAIDYSSHGKVAVAGDANNWPPVADAVRQLGDAVSLVLLEDENAAAPVAEKRDGIPATVCRVLSASGHLGAFVFHARDDNGEGEAPLHADAVLDLRASPLFARRVLPPGCFRPPPDALGAAIESLRDMRGVFRKPKYFRYRESLCAHREDRGCSLCIAACPAEAIASAGDKIEVNARLCQGCGACATVCPGGAIQYDYPPPRDIHSALRESAAVFREQSNGAAPLALFHAESDSQAAANSPAHIVPLPLEEVGAAGMETWFCALAYGFGGAAVWTAEPETRKLAESQAKIANDILSAMGFPRAARIVGDRDEMEKFAAEFAENGMRIPRCAKFAPQDDKRTMFFAALDFLLESAGSIPDAAALDSGAPFGEAVVDAEKCTLCMACAGACPASAIRAGGDSPRLLFVEENCLQCGLCESACPEDAVTLRGRMLFSRDARRTARVLNEEAPFCCLSCGKPFATARMIARVEAKLRGHWMYKDDAARRRLRLCEDCRAAEMFGGEFIRRSDGDEEENN